MRMFIWVFGPLMVAASLDSWLFDSLYTDGFVRMLSDIAAGFGLG
jgi:hypothetical protein